jgi:hypothetical protein
MTEVPNQNVAAGEGAVKSLRAVLPTGDGAQFAWYFWLLGGIVCRFGKGTAHALLKFRKGA